MTGTNEDATGITVCSEGGADRGESTRAPFLVSVHRWPRRALRWTQGGVESQLFTTIGKEGVHEKCSCAKSYRTHGQPVVGRKDQAKHMAYGWRCRDPTAGRTDSGRTHECWRAAARGSANRPHSNVPSRLARAALQQRQRTQGMLKKASVGRSAI